MTSDKTLARKAARDSAAFGELFDRYALKVYRYVHSRVHHHESAEDITSQVFHDAFEHISDYKPVGPFAAWLFTIARRRIADFFRRSHPTQSLTEEVVQDSQDPLTRIIKEEDLGHLEKQLQTLEDEERELLRLRFAAGLRYQDIGVLFNKKPGAIKIAIYRLLDRLKANMEDSYGSE